MSDDHDGADEGTAESDSDSGSAPDADSAPDPPAADASDEDLPPDAVAEPNPFEELDDLERGPDPTRDDLDEVEFEAVDTGGLDDEAIWADLTADTDDADDADADGAVSEPEAPPADVVESRDAPEGAVETVVPKRTYCEDCEFFSPPPDVVCRHEGTSIVELVDMGHFRVSNCPVVAQRQQVATDTGLEDDTIQHDDAAAAPAEGAGAGADSGSEAGADSDASADAADE